LPGRNAFKNYGVVVINGWAQCGAARVIRDSMPRVQRGSEAAMLLVTPPANPTYSTTTPLNPKALENKFILLTLFASIN